MSVAPEAERVAAAVPALVVGQGDLLGQLEERRLAPRENVAPNVGVGGHDAELVGRQLAGLQKDGVGNSDLAYVMQGGRQPDQLHHLVGKSKGQSQQCRDTAHALRVLAGVIVAKFGGQGQPLQNLDPSPFQVARTLLHLDLQDLILVLQSQVEEAGFQQVFHPQHDFRQVKRLRQEILGPIKQELVVSSTAFDRPSTPGWGR